MDIELRAFNAPWLQHRILTRFALVVFGLLFKSIILHAQAKPTASRVGDLQVGVAFNLASPDYGANTLRGFGAYASFDFLPHWGLEAAFHHLGDPDPKEGIYERTYEIGPRYVFRFGPLSPYAKLMVGRGVFQFPPDPRHPENGSVANLAYTMWAGGFGADYRLRRSINLRADYELQRWGSFPPNGLSPHVFGVGVAYHFH